VNQGNGVARRRREVGWVPGRVFNFGMSKQDLDGMEVDQRYRSWLAEAYASFKRSSW
jgi:hypothetical protein